MQPDPLNLYRALFGPPELIPGPPGVDGRPGRMKRNPAALARHAAKELCRNEGARHAEAAAVGLRFGQGDAPTVAGFTTGLALARRSVRPSSTGTPSRTGAVPAAGWGGVA